MEIADESGYGGSDWVSKDVRFMWSTIANHNTDTHFDVVQGWSRTAELTLAHLSQVRKYRDNLANVWPPAKSAAAAAYIARLDKLLGDLQATHDAAAANYTAFSTVTLVLSQARTKLKPIFEQYEANEQLNLDWQAKQDEAAKSGKPVLTPTLSIPPVSTSRQEQLNNQARAIMYDLSSTVISAQSTLQKPKLYKPGEFEGSGDGRGDTKGNDGSPGFAVPPVVPAPGSSNGSSVSTDTPASTSTATPGRTPVRPTTITPIRTGGAGPILGGAGLTPVTNLPVTGHPPTPVPMPPGSVPGIISPPGVPGFLPSGRVPPITGRIPERGQLKPGVGGGPTGRPTMPPGGVIGATPGSGMIGQIPGGVPGRSQNGSPARVNPVGGVIGQQGSGNLGGPRVQGRARRDGEDNQNRWDPDRPWATAEGVDPVVLPPEDPGPIDPGPVIGYAR